MRQTVAVLVTLGAFACSAPEAGQKPAAQQAPAAQPAPAKQEPAKSTGSLPDGWKVRFDAPAAADVVHLNTADDSLTFTTGPAGIYYKTDMKAEKDYTLSATFSQLKPTPTPQPYGLFIAGADLDKDTARYTAFLLRSDGKYQIVAWNAAAPRVVVDWTAAPQMRELKGVKTSNSITIRALQGAVHFLVGEKEVHQMPRAKAGADGIAGVRIGSDLNVQVDRLSVKKFPE